MRILKRIAPYAVIVAAALLLLYLPDIGPESYTDLATFFRVERARQGYAGFAVAAVKGGSILYLDGFGTDGAGRPMGPETRLLVAAAAKPFAGAASMALATKGSLELDRPVRHYLPAFSFAGGGGGEVRVRDLAAHASGVADAGFDDAHETAHDLAAAVGSLSSARPVAAPGAEFHPIETGYQALGLVLEAASGERYAEILDRLLFRPLAMSASDARPEAAGPSLAKGSASFFALVLPRDTLVPGFGAPSGHVVSTAADLGIFLSFLVAPEKVKRPPLPARAARSLLEPLVPGIPYAFGWTLGEEGGSPALWSEGTLPGFSSRLSVWPREKAALAILAAEDSLLHAKISLPAMSSAARRIILEGSSERPFPVGRLYILLAVAAFVNLAGLVYQTGEARRWAKFARDKAEARGSRGPVAFATARTWVGLSVRVAAALLAPAALSLALGRAASWKTAFDLEPGLAAWWASVCFFGALRNAARLVWLGGHGSFRRPRGRWLPRLRRSSAS